MRQGCEDEGKMQICAKEAATAKGLSYGRRQWLEHVTLPAKLHSEWT